MTQADPRSRILTIPNAISFLRLLGVPLFLYLFLGPHAWGWAVAVLAIGGTTDWIDGYLARRLGQVSRLGELMDPVADRLYILATIVALTVEDVVPWAFTIALLAREAVLSVVVLILRRYGVPPLPVHYVGKTATFILLFAFPVLLLAATTDGAVSSVSHAAGWALAWWGLVLYWVAGGLYILQARSVIRAKQPAAAGGSA
ncbi:MAG: CDP-alcohol phosphatidyltransferase family protein [Hamadaea sp.]|uniref:CDP-alcohol phosphatidyltransferase family protein n=1 Tax=Hamadaea sp. TaxID=2024425 RepID=UPI00181692E9|nr:CDP-alcohol phosphatidyltransferase family protein [Hamadaea sp.]NUR70175.1 CDP-alcohol phosphatidyltransferase family protein [Hamadaea sp.]NUT21174.1 CDP-alcohol phosphatidyltransferase family protein [Hamadaea sp.]